MSFQAFVRLMLARPPADFACQSDSSGARRYAGWFLLVNGSLIALLWLGVVVPPLFSGTLYPAGLAHFTTMTVQGFDLALFLPPSLLAGLGYLRRRSPSELLDRATRLGARFVCRRPYGDHARRDSPSDRG